MQYFYLYIIVVSLISVVLTVLDKHNARLHRWRVRERTLFLFAVCGGSLAMYATMLWIRHKTKHKRFMLGLPTIMIAQIILLFVLK